jgi:hypothetical protein
MGPAGVAELVEGDLRTIFSKSVCSDVRSSPDVFLEMRSSVGVVGSVSLSTLPATCVVSMCTLLGIALCEWSTSLWTLKACRE